MKRALIAAGMLIALSGPALADFKEDMAAIGESIKTLTRQRDEAIRDREYWASRACPIYTSSAYSSNPDLVIAFKIPYREANTKSSYTLADIDNPDTGVCLLRIAGECVLGYDSKTHAIVATRRIRTVVEGRK